MQVETAVANIENIIMTDAEVDAYIAALDSYTGPTWNVQPGSQILADLAARKPKNNVHMHRGQYGGNRVEDLED